MTLRLIVHPHLDGNKARIRLSNRFGRSPVRFGAVFIGRSAGGAKIAPGTNRRISFGGRETVSLAPGREVTSDPVSFAVPRSKDVAVSIHVAEASAPTTSHADAHQISFIGHGNRAARIDDLGFGQLPTLWPYLIGIDVRRGGNAGAVVAFGDSITDGFQTRSTGAYDATTSRNHRYPDFLARRLARAGRNALGVLNAGLSGNRLLSGGAAAIAAGRGPAGLSRFSTDALSQPGISDLIIVEGTNDISVARSASAIVAGLKDLVRRGQRAGLNVMNADPGQWRPWAFGPHHCRRARKGQSLDPRTTPE